MCEEIKDEESVAKEIERILVDAWNNFLDYYKKKAPEYRENWPVKPKDKKQAEKGAKESHWICWDEYDLMFHIGRIFYDKLRQKGKEFSNIEIHFEKNVNPTNFEGYVFESKFPKLKENLGGKYPKVDMIAAYEDKNFPFLLCAELKYIHCAQNKPEKTIEADIKKLEVIGECEIAQRLVFILFDDYYYYKRGQRTAKKIKKLLDKIKEGKKDIITVLDSTSEEKLPQHLKDWLRS
jgi:hypothetical protein